MPPASAPSLYTILPDSSALDPEFLRVLRIADPGSALDGALTFAPPASSVVQSWLEAWQAWRDGLLAGSLGAAIVAAAEHAGQGKAREIQEISLSFQTVLEPVAAARSAQAGARLLQRLSTSRGERWVGKLQAWGAAGGTMHFPVVYAAQSALFHLPLRLLLPGYAYWEWTAALAATLPTKTRRPDFIQEVAGLRTVAEAVLSARKNHADHLPAAFGGS